MNEFCCSKVKYDRGKGYDLGSKIEIKKLVGNGAHELLQCLCFVDGISNNDCKIKKDCFKQDDDCEKIVGKFSSIVIVKAHIEKDTRYILFDECNDTLYLRKLLECFENHDIEKYIYIQPKSTIPASILKAVNEFGYKETSCSKNTKHVYMHKKNQQVHNT